MTTYTWEVESLDCVPESNTVSCVHWRLKGDDGVNTSEVYGLQNIEQSTKNGFIAYEALTKEKVLGWAQAAMGADTIIQLQDVLDKQLDALANPSVVSLPLPWANNA